MSSAIYIHTCGKPILVGKASSGRYLFYKKVKADRENIIRNCPRCNGLLLQTDVGTLLQPITKILSNE